MSSGIVIGGYGTFGSQVARELARRGVALTIAGRDGGRAEAFARSLGPNHRWRRVDVTRLDDCREAITGHRVVVHCAGPFGDLGTALLDAALTAGCHYVDLGDDRRYTRVVQSYGERFRERGLAAVYGCSSLPGISGALALRLRREFAESPERARVTLFIGNNNPKGAAAVQSLLAGLGRPIEAPQGTVRGFRDREVVPLPEPFGRRGVFNFESPEYDLFPSLLGVRSALVKVGFELRLATYGFALLAMLGLAGGRRTARVLDLLARPLRWVGCSGGAVMVELFDRDGQSRSAAIVAREDGQRMAALPCALVAHALMRSDPTAFGSMTAYDFLGCDVLLDGLTSAGFALKETRGAV
jgi:hypothetical protein